MVGYILLLWLLFAVITQIRQALEARGRRLVITALDYTIQTLYHGLLLFVLPSYYASGTLTSPNVAFFAILVALALLATFDPWYRALVHPRPWLGYVFFLTTLFAGLNLALPLVDVPPYPALLISAWVAVVALTPAVRRVRQWPWRRALVVSALAGLLAAWVASVARAWIPPAPLSLARATLAWDVANGEPVDPIGRVLSVEDLRQHGILVAYTAVYAPAGLRQPITHVWRHAGQVVTVVKLSPVHGGRREGFRTYSRKSEFPMNPLGRWSVDVVTSSGQLIGRLRFRLTP